MPNSRRKNKTLVSFNGKKVNRYHNDFVDQDMMHIETGKFLVINLDNVDTFMLLLMDEERWPQLHKL